MKDRIEAEVVKVGELDRNVKLGRGGIREIEFVAQTLQPPTRGVSHSCKGPRLADAQQAGARTIDPRRGRFAD